MTEKIFQFIFWLLKAIDYRAPVKNKFCPNCRHPVAIFLPMGNARHFRLSAKCPYCNSLERTRFHYFYYFSQPPLTNNTSISLLHFAPEPEIKRHFDQLPQLNYYPVDLNPAMPGIRETANITKLHYHNQQFDLIICSHVLEHITNDQQALRELYRVLKRNGKCYLSVPLSGKSATYENDAITSPAGRLKHFGQADHVRWYGDDITTRFRQIGFKVNTINCRQYFNPTQIKHYGLSPQEKIFILTK